MSFLQGLVNDASISNIKNVKSNIYPITCQGRHNQLWITYSFRIFFSTYGVLKSLSHTPITASQMQRSEPWLRLKSSAKKKDTAQLHENINKFLQLSLPKWEKWDTNVSQERTCRSLSSPSFAAFAERRKFFDKLKILQKIDAIYVIKKMKT